MANVGKKKIGGKKKKGKGTRADKSKADGPCLRPAPHENTTDRFSDWMLPVTPSLPIARQLPLSLFFYFFFFLKLAITTLLFYFIIYYIILYFS